MCFKFEVSAPKILSEIFLQSKNNQITAKMKTFISMLLSAVALASEGITELTTDKGLDELLAKHDFTVLSMYLGSDKESKEIDSVMDGAKSAFEKMLKDNSLPERSVGWYRADIEKHPELDMQGIGMTDQMVLSHKNDVSRFIHFIRSEAPKDKDAEAFGAIIRSLTGEWYEPITCE